MPKLRARLIDRNRYAKRYPLIRAPKRLTYLGETDIAMELGSVYFDNKDTGTLTFEIPLPDTSYQVVATARDSGNSEGADVNIYIDGQNTTSESVTIKASALFTGYVDVFVVRVG